MGARTAEQLAQAGAAHVLSTDDRQRPERSCSIDQIRVNAVTPLITRGTRTYDRMMADEFTRKLFAKAEGRARLGVASAENVAPTAVFLASPLASHLTGQVISVNGGISVA